jgi:hypothetical protein
LLYLFRSGSASETASSELATAAGAKNGEPALWAWSTAHWTSSPESTIQRSTIQGATIQGDVLMSTDTPTNPNQAPWLSLDTWAVIVALALALAVRFDIFGNVPW